MRTIEIEGLGNAWVAVARAILDEGQSVATELEAWRELKHIYFRVLDPSLPDRIIEQYADADDLRWMTMNFSDQSPVAGLGGSRSYASRLYSYGGAKDQIGWVVERLRKNPLTRSATITTLEPLTDESYIPCISLLDFDASEGRVDLVAYARSLDLGRKAHANLVCLARILGDVAENLDLPTGRLIVIIKSAHIYVEDEDWMRSIVAEC